MKVWLHVLAAFLGLALAGMIVFMVFGNASRNAASEGNAPSAQTETADLCGSINATEAFDKGSVSSAHGDLPPILNDKQVPVVPNQPHQITWFAQLHAASGFCLDEIVVLPRALTVSATFPKSISQAQVDAFAFNTLTQAFKPPLARSSVKLEVLDGEQKRSVTITSEAWNNFVSGRASLGLDPSIDGLREFKREVGYGPAKLRVSNW